MKSQKSKVKSQSFGFTFIELLVVVTIIALISGVAVASYQTTNQKARDARRKSDLEQIRAGLELCRSEYGAYPDSVYTDDGGVNALVCDDGDTYLSPTPLDPRDGQSVSGTDYGYTFTRGYSTGSLTEYSLCANLMESTSETSPYCVYNP